ncbi:hypothetical protein SK355_10930 [Candidatus Fukatsuia symbiotica]|uniref:Uncharacterized protein n=1 Tax=Candidatus Fukatsuia symbiotica TaxID=1878942 RepID=A0A2U8I7P5_9GAMM|nr:hypothetical protein [Candidatus Fukatsuia symbiotica]AWK13954.1 hypothetical protein CCS41_04840 [Candidatus Fukatsuia symbiotica]MEA9445703.1 hypothetical protein [Candidatus Fukatsuia symbiotica]
MKKIKAVLTVLPILLLPLFVSAYQEKAPAVFVCKFQPGLPFFSCVEQQMLTEKAIPSDTDASSSVRVKDDHRRNELNRNELRRLRKLTLFL